MNENYSHPEKPQGADDGILRGMYLLKENNNKGKTKVQLLGSGTILREVIEAADKAGLAMVFTGMRHFKH